MGMYIHGLYRWDVPPDCPACGAPFTSCTPESHAKKLAEQQAKAAAAPPAIAEPAPVTFTPSTYRRKLHGPDVKTAVKR